MTKEELVYLTLKQLAESFKTSPENFRLEDPTTGQTSGSFPGPTVIWQYKVQVNDNQFIVDPLNAVKTIIVTYNKMAKQLQCYIYNREVNNLNHAMMADAQATITYNEFLPTFLYRTYRQFTQLKKSILKRRHDKEFMDYMRRLNGIFPGTHEDELFK